MFEILVSVSLFAVIILLSASMYSLSQQTYRKGADQGELVQNARVSIDRISREIRQSVDIVTDLPETPDDIENPPTEEIFFQDGHDISQITYLRYYLDGSDLRRSNIIYYYDEEPSIYVTYNSVDQYGEPPEELILEDRVVGEYFNDLQFWGSGGLVYIYQNLAKNRNIFKIRTAVYSRN